MPGPLVTCTVAKAGLIPTLAALTVRLLEIRVQYIPTINTKCFALEVILLLVYSVRVTTWVET